MPLRTRLTGRQLAILEELDTLWAEEMRWSVLLVLMKLQEGIAHRENFTLFDRRYRVEGNVDLKAVQVWQLDN